MLVPVNPVCPNDPSGNRSPRFAENEVFMSQPNPRVAPSSETTYGAVIFATVWTDKMRRPAAAGGPFLSEPGAVATGFLPRREERTTPSAEAAATTHL